MRMAVGVNCKPDRRALVVKPSGVLPQYALMACIQCSLGEQAQLNAIHNLGAFIQHVAALPASALPLDYATFPNRNLEATPHLRNIS
jgi:hypothetical protein